MNTPRTDAFISKFYGNRSLSSGSRHRTDVELHDFARQLERELAAAQAQRDKARDETLELAAQMCDEEAKSWVVPSKIMYGRLADKFRAKKGCGK